MAFVYELQNVLQQKNVARLAAFPGQCALDEEASLSIDDGRVALIRIGCNILKKVWSFWRQGGRL